MPWRKRKIEQHGRVRGERAGQAGQGEQADADEEHRASRGDVADPTRGHEREAEGERVSGDDRLQLRGTGAEGRFDRRQPDVDLRQIEDRQRCNGDADDERPALGALVDLGSLVRRAGRRRGGHPFHGIPGAGAGGCAPVSSAEQNPRPTWEPTVSGSSDAHRRHRAAGRDPAAGLPLRHLIRHTDRADSAAGASSRRRRGGMGRVRRPARSGLLQRIRGGRHRRHREVPRPCPAEGAGPDRGPGRTHAACLRRPSHRQGRPRDGDPRCAAAIRGPELRELSRSDEGPRAERGLRRHPAVHRRTRHGGRRLSRRGLPADQDQDQTRLGRRAGARAPCGVRRYPAAGRRQLGLHARRRARSSRSSTTTGCC